MTHSFAALVAISRDRAGSAAEFDYAVAMRGRNHYRDAFYNAAWILASREFPPAATISPEDSDTQRRAITVRADELLAAYDADIQSFGVAASGKSYTGALAAQNGYGRIQYAR